MAHVYPVSGSRVRGRLGRARSLPVSPWTLDGGLVSFLASFFPRGCMPLTKKQLGHLEKRLLDERERALKALGLFDKMTKADRESGDSDLAAYTDHMADQGTEAMEREEAPSHATNGRSCLYRRGRS